MPNKLCADVVLIDTGFDGKQRFLLKQRSQPHLGLAYIAAYLERYHFRVKIIDRIINPLNPVEIAEAAIGFNPKIVGITTSTTDRFFAIRILNALKLLSPQTLTVGGGPHFSSTPVDALEKIKSLDVVCVGEGELTMLEVVKKYKQKSTKTDFKGIDGVVYRNAAGKIIHNPPRKLIRDLDSLPSPAWHLFEMDKYIGTLATVDGVSYRAIGIGSSRGCPYSCSFCYNSLSKKVRTLSVTRFVDLIEELVIRYKLNAFNFVDDSFACNPARVIAICDEIIKRGLNIKWYCSLNVNQAAKHINMLKYMRKAGCIALGFGVEFPDDDILKAINKNSTTALIKRAILNVKKIDFPFIYIFLLQGLPAQTIKKTILANFRTIFYRLLLKDQKIYFGGFVQIYPGTQLEALSIAQGDIDFNFSWNTPYISKVALKYSNTPNQHNKIPTLPIYEPTQIPLDTILVINKIMTYLAKFINLNLTLFERLVGKRKR